MNAWGQAIERRSSDSPDPRCQRQGKCRIMGRWFCYQHYPLWRRHYEIVERIRSFPDRAI
jgi:hypothetical protein